MAPINNKLIIIGGVKFFGDVKPIRTEKQNNFDYTVQLGNGMIISFDKQNAQNESTVQFNSQFGSNRTWASKFSDGKGLQITGTTGEDYIMVKDSKLFGINTQDSDGDYGDRVTIWNCAASGETASVIGADQVSVLDSEGITGENIEIDSSKPSPFSKQKQTKPRSLSSTKTTFGSVTGLNTVKKAPAEKQSVQTPSPSKEQGGVRRGRAFDF